MRIFSASVLVLGLSALGAACADAVPDEGVGINRGALGSAPSNPSLDAVGGRYVVKFRDVHAGKAALNAAGARVALELGPQKAAAAHIPAQALEALSRNPHIEYIEEDVIRKPLASGDGTEVAPYGISMVQADQVAPGSGDVKVCIIDSGYYRSHEDLNANTSAVTGTNNSGTGNWYEDSCGHGTHVAGTISAVDNQLGVIGVFPSAKLHIIKVFNGDACDWTYSSTLVDALNKCRDSAGGSKLVVSMSLGGDRASRTEDSAFANAYNAGVLSIAAAGNDGNTKKSYPASYASVMSVAAIDSNKVVADFSQKNDAVEISAPGVSVLSTVPWTSATAVVDGRSYLGTGIDFALATAASGALVDGGICDGTGSWSGKVVLCQRGTVSFYDKVNNVQRSGGAAAIIYNNVSGGFAGTLGDGNTSTIPAIGISLEDGLFLVSNKLGLSATVNTLVVKPGSGYEGWDGTSMATPHVSGVAALVWSHFAGKSNADIRSALTATAEDLGAAGRDTAYGYGLVRAKAAYDALGGSGGGGGGCEPVAEVCNDLVDNDCDGLVDGYDSDCATSCTLGERGDSCTTGADCCSGSCGGKPGRRTCK